jgi:hypothetical protein
VKQNEHKISPLKAKNVTIHYIFKILDSVVRKNVKCKICSYIPPCFAKMNGRIVYNDSKQVGRGGGGGGLITNHTLPSNVAFKSLKCSVKPGRTS